VVKFRVTSTSEVLEPRTSATSATHFARFIDGAASGAYQTSGRRRVFARLHALKPPVINVFVAHTSAVLKPSTARSATTISAGFLKRAAFGTRHRLSDR